MKKKISGFTLIEIMTVIAVMALLIAIMFPHFWRAYSKSRYTACISNLKNIATALQIYSTENNSFPESLDDLKPDYLKIIPACPEAATDTYTAGYEVNGQMTVFTICCKGHYHALLDYGEDEPYYRSTSGLGPNH